MTGANIEAMSRGMTPEKALRWLLEFGSDWVDCGELLDTWADTDIYWQVAGKQGYLEGREEDGEEGEINCLRLTPKALELIQNLGELKCTEANR